MPDYDWGRALNFAQNEMFRARADADEEAEYLAEMLARGVETTSSFAETSDRYDTLKRDALRWEAVRDAVSRAGRHQG